MAAYQSLTSTGEAWVDDVEFIRWPGLISGAQVEAGSGRCVEDPINPARPTQLVPHPQSCSGSTSSPPSDPFRHYPPSSATLKRPSHSAPHSPSLTPPPTESSTKAPAPKKARKESPVPPSPAAVAPVPVQQLPSPTSQADKMSSDGEEEFEFEDDDEAFDVGSGEDGSDGGGESISDAEAFDIMSPTLEEPPEKKPYDVNYRVRTMQEIMDMQTKEVKKVQSLLEVPADTAATLLRYYAWNSEKLQEQFWNDPTAALVSAGLSPPSSPSTSTQPLPSPLASPRRARNARTPMTPSKRSRSSGPFECPICCMDYTKEQTATQTLALGCGHRFCRGCWTEYVVGKITTEGESGRIQCMETGCSRIVRAEPIDELVTSDVSKKYHNLLNQAFVSDAPSLRWCPHPGCEHIIECSQAPQKMLNQLVPTVTCRCGNDLCFGCGYPASHRPVICRIVKLWEKKCADDSETANWLQANTKECTKCQSTIEKNGGCNHMTCKKCKWEFCWVCMGPWSEHGTAWYQCNRFDEKSGSDNRDHQAKSRQSLERYLHYFNRWANHEHSAKLDADFYKSTQKKMEQMQSSANMSWIEVQFAKQAVDTVIAARITLKWSYCMAFYLKRNNMTELFEDNQRDLERAVETLGYSLEQNIGDVGAIAKLRQEVTNQSAYVQKRHDILMDDTLRGYLEHRWEFTV